MCKVKAKGLHGIKKKRVAVNIVNHREDFYIAGAIMYITYITLMCHGCKLRN